MAFRSRQSNQSVIIPGRIALDLESTMGNQTTKSLPSVTTSCSPVQILPEGAARVLRLLAEQEMKSASLLTGPRDAGAEFEREYLAAALFMGAKYIEENAKDDRSNR